MTKTKFLNEKVKRQTTQFLLSLSGKSGPAITVVVAARASNGKWALSQQILRKVSVK